MPPPPAHSGRPLSRRDFLHSAAAAALAASLSTLRPFVPSRRMGVVVHSYGIRFNRDNNNSSRYPAFRDATDLIRHCHEIGAGGVQVGVRGWTDDFAGKVRDLREKLEMYLEGSIALPANEGAVAEFEREIAQAKEAGASVVRTVCLNGRRYENFDTLEQFHAFRTNAVRSLELAEPVVGKHRIRLAVENHKDWRAPELAAILRRLSSEWIGATIDFGNNVSLLEEPLTTVETLAPYVFSTHVKDMGVREYEDGFLLSEVPLGNGICDLRRMIEVCRGHNAEVNFNLEMITRDPLKVPCLTDRYWATFEGLSGAELAKTLKLVKTRSYAEALPTVSHMAPDGQLAEEEENVVRCLRYSMGELGLK